MKLLKIKLYSHFSGVVVGWMDGCDDFLVWEFAPH